MHKAIGRKPAVVLLVLIFVMITNFQSAYSLNNNFKFKNITIEDGLSESSVETIYQDSKGYMWFGTDDGLNRYDGSKFNIYRYNSENKNSISSNVVGSIAEDGKGNLWLATSDGLNKVNKDRTEIVRYKFEENNKSSLSNNNVWSVLVSKTGDVWIATEDGLNKYDEKEDKFTRYFSDPKNKNTIANNFITCLYEDKDGLLWIGTKNGLNTYDKTTNTFKTYVSKGVEGSLSNNIIKTICGDSEGNIWIGTEKGVNKYNKASGKFKVYVEGKDSLPSNSVQVVYEDSYKNLWLGTDKGLCMYNKEKDNFISYLNKYYDSHSLLDNNVLSIYQDKSGIVWVGTVSGISTFYPKQIFENYTNNPLDNNSLSSNMISGIYEDEDKSLWVGTVSNGLNVINRETNEVKLFVNDKNNDNSISSDCIKTITGDGLGNIWIATGNGLNKYNKTTGEFTRYVNDPLNKNSLTDDAVRFLYFDSKKMMWIGTRNGLDLFNPNTEQFTHYSEVLKNNGVSDNLITSIYEDKKGYIWIGCGLNGGLVRLDRKNNTIKVYKNIPGLKNSLSCNSIKAINGDNNGNLWIATNSGLNKLNLSSGKFTVYTEKDGLCNDYIYAVLIDKYNNPWVSTDGGISKLAVNENKFYNFTIADGMPSNEFNAYSYYKNSGGEMFFGGISGLTSFEPDNFQLNSFKPKVQIEDLTIDDKPITIENKISLKYNENNISFEFFIDDYKNVSKNQYAYMLEGVDKDWVYSNNRNYVSYTNIKSGSYTFKVKGRNSTGVWSEPTEVTITVKSAPWKSWWAYTIYFSVIILVIYLVRNYVVILEGIIKKRTIQLNNKLEENEVLYKTLIKYEQVKNNYFVNLSHELKTPLNVILSTFQLIEQFDIEKIPLPKEKLDKYMSIIKRNSNSLLKVINDLIDTSKIDAGHYKLYIGEVDIVYLVEEVSLSMKDYVESNGLEFIIDPEVEEMTIECDANEIERCVVNLISNAVKFTPSGGAILVKLKDKGDFVQISVRDTGIGIEEENQKIIFDRFGQINGNDANKKIGSGIGLTLVKSLIAMHGGEIEVISKSGEGSEFIITLPKEHIDKAQNLIN